MSFAEYHGSDAYYGATLFDSDRVVVCHAFGELTKGGFVNKVGILELVEECSHLAEFTAYLLHVVSVAAHGHEACDAHMV